MTLRFYERLGHENRRPSPFSWRIRYALAHKQLEPEVVPVTFAEVHRIEAISGQRFVPVIEHAGKVVADSWEIAVFLEQSFPDHPTLFGGARGQSVAHFISRWTDESVHPLIRNLILPDFVEVLEEEDRRYYRASRELVLGHTLEDCVKNHERLAIELNDVLAPLGRTLQTQPYLAGETPAYADYAVFGAFQWARLGCPRSIVPPGNDVVQSWLTRMRALYDGLADHFPGFPPTSEKGDGGNTF